MINLRWGGLINGEIPKSLLVDVSGKGDYLESTAAANFLRMRADLHAATGVWINPAPGSSAYRPEAIQEQFYDAYRAYLRGGPWAAVAAVPPSRGGQGSNHGWARAVDITGYEGNTAWRSPRTGTVYMVNLAVWNWLLAHAAEYGYDWATGDYSGEPWHWESLAAPGTVTAADAAHLLAAPAPILPKETEMYLYVQKQGNLTTYILYIPARNTYQTTQDTTTANQWAVLVGHDAWPIQSEHVLALDGIRKQFA